MKDLRIKIKLILSVIVLLTPWGLAIVLDDHLMLRYISYSVFVISCLFFNESHFLGFVKTWFRFHFLQEYRKGLSPKAYKYFKERIKTLSEKNEAYHEQRLIRQILDESGEEVNKVKFAGKNKNKLKLKHRRTFENDNSKNRKYSNYKLA